MFSVSEKVLTLNTGFIIHNLLYTMYIAEGLDVIFNKLTYIYIYIFIFIFSYIKSLIMNCFYKLRTSGSHEKRCPHSCIV